MKVHLSGTFGYIRLYVFCPKVYQVICASYIQLYVFRANCVQSVLMCINVYSRCIKSGVFKVYYIFRLYHHTAIYIMVRRIMPLRAYIAHLPTDICACSHFVSWRSTG